MQKIWHLLSLTLSSHTRFCQRGMVTIMVNFIHHFYCLQCSSYTFLFINKNVRVNRKVINNIHSLYFLLCRQDLCHVLFYINSTYQLRSFETDFFILYIAFVTIISGLSLEIKNVNKNTAKN